MSHWLHCRFRIQINTPSSAGTKFVTPLYIQQRPGGMKICIPVVEGEPVIDIIMHIPVPSGTTFHDQSCGDRMRRDPRQHFTSEILLSTMLIAKDIFLESKI